MAREIDKQSLARKFAGKDPLQDRSAVCEIDEAVGYAIVRTAWHVVLARGLTAVAGLVGCGFAVVLWVNAGEKTNEPLLGWGDDGLTVSPQLAISLLAIAGILLIVVGLLNVLPRRIEFDRTRGVMTVRPRLGLPRRYRFQTLRALQICRKSVVRDGPQSFIAYELNVLQGSRHIPRRIRVMAHGDRSKLLEDANRLAEFLGLRIIRSDKTQTPTINKKKLWRRRPKKGDAS